MLEMVAYFFGWIIGVVLGAFRLIIQWIYKVSTVPAIKTAKFIAQKIKNTETEGSQ